MATESTAIVNLVDLMKKRPVPVSTGDDDLFGGNVRFDPMAMPSVAAPVSLPTPVGFDQRIRISPPIVRREQEDPRRALVKKLALPTVLFTAAMVLLSVYLAKGDDKPAPKAAANVTVVQAPAPVVQPIEAPVVTPIEAPKAVEEAKPVEEVKPTFEPTVPEVNDAPVEENVVEKPVAKKAKSKRAAKRAKATKRVAIAEQPKAKSEKLGGKGALQLSSSPAREVWIDGRNTKQMTPQRLTLKPGTHNITLFDKKTRSAKTFQVEIKPNETTRVSKKY